MTVALLGSRPEWGCRKRLVPPWKTFALGLAALTMAACAEAPKNTTPGGDPPSAAPGFFSQVPGMGAEVELPGIQLVHVKDLGDGQYALQTVRSQDTYDTSPINKMIVSTATNSAGTGVPRFSVTADIHMPFGRSMYAGPGDSPSQRMLVSRTLELISGPEPASVLAQEAVQHHMALFWKVVVESAVPWTDVKSLGESFSNVVVTGPHKVDIGNVSAKRLIELGAIGNYATGRIYGLAMFPDVVRRYNEAASEHFQLTEWAQGMDFGLLVKSGDANIASPQVSIGLTANGYNAETLAPNFSCSPVGAQTPLTEAQLRHNCRESGWTNPREGVTACFPSDCLGRACYLSGARAFEEARAAEPTYALAETAQKLLASVLEDGSATPEDLEGPVGDLVTSALIQLRCSALALSQDVGAPEWKLKNMFGNLPKITWSGFRDNHSTRGALQTLEAFRTDLISMFACNPNGSVNVTPKLFISAPGDSAAPQTPEARLQHCESQVERLFTDPHTVGGGTPFAPGMIAGQPAFVVESRMGRTELTQGFRASERWVQGSPYELAFTGDILISVGFVCAMSGFGFDGDTCLPPAVDPSVPESGLPVIAGGDPFVFEWTLEHGGSVKQLPLERGTFYDYIVDWGDGTSERIFSYDYPGATTSPPVHSYDSAGPHTVTISGTVEAMSFEGDPHLTRVSNLGDVGWKSTANMFRFCRALTTVSGGRVDAVTNMSGMFLGAPQVRPDVKFWDVLNVTDMQEMFAFTGAANPDVAYWDVSSVTNMRGMFEYAKAANPQVNFWNVSNVTNMSRLFWEASSAEPETGAWDFSSVTECYEGPPECR